MKKHKRVEYDELIELGVHTLDLKQTYDNVCRGKAGCHISDNARSDVRRIYETLEVSGPQSYRCLLVLSNDPPHALVATSPKKQLKLRGKLRLASTLALIELASKGVLDQHKSLLRNFQLSADTSIVWEGGHFTGTDDTVLVFEPVRGGLLYWEES